MSTRSTYTARSERAVLIVAGSFRVVAGVITDTLGEGFTVTRTAAGKYHVVFDKTFGSILSVNATLQSAAPIDRFCGVFSKTASGFDIYLWDVSGLAVTDPGAGTDDRINFTAMAKDSVV